MPTVMRAPRGGRGLRNGMAVELHSGTIILDVERVAPRDTRWRGRLALRGLAPKGVAYEGAEIGEIVTFAQGNVARMWKEEA